MDEDVLEDVLLLDEDEVPSSAIRLCRLAASLPGPPAFDEPLDPLDVEVLPLCACSALIRLCKKPLMACAALEVPDEELLESELVDLLDVPVLLVPVTPICDKASAMAPIKPPPPPGGGGGMLPTVLLLPDCVLHPICDVR